MISTVTNQGKTSWMIIDGAEAAITNIAKGYDIAAMQQSATVDEVVVYGDHAHALGTWALTPPATAGSDIKGASGKWLVIYKRQPDGAWQTWRWIWNQPTPAAAG
jgi:ketosteroid isomerase-like protein